MAREKKAICYWLSAISQSSGRRPATLYRKALCSRQPTADSRQRRGVILLVVMALLALFSVVVLTFVIVARQHKQSAEAMLHGKYYDRNYEEHLNQAALQIIRGTNNPLSVLGPHSLLEDMYGNGPMGQGSTSGTVTDVVAIDADNQLFALTLNPAPTETVRGYYAGRVITLYKGGRAESYRVVDYGAPEPFADANGNGVRDLMPAPGESYTDLNGNSTYDTFTTSLVVLINGEYRPDNFASLPPTSDDPEFILNGRAFAGPGFGFNPEQFANTSGADDLLNYNLGGGLIALLPNPRHAEYQHYLKHENAAGAATDGAGLPYPFPIANEEYDVADYQNMILAFQQARETLSSNAVPIPSLHRPALLNYWIQQVGGLANFNANTPAAAALRRRVLMRPDHITDNPSFPPPSNILNGPWDVDNDGDGVRDSIWVDLGMPVQTAPDGRQYKPLFAIHCLDMDGRLNVNVHGQLNDWANDASAATRYVNPWKQLPTLDRPANPVPPGTAEMAGTAPLNGRAKLPAGLGLGPQEVSLSATLDGSGGYFSLVEDYEFRQLLRGLYNTTTGQWYEGRYGESHLLPATAYNTDDPAILAGETGSDDNNPALPVPVTTGNNIPPDADANGVLGLGPDGQPRFAHMSTPNGRTSIAETTDESAELDPTRRRKMSTGAGLANVDNLFSPAEFEALLRRHDVDATMLTSRLASLAPSLFNGNGTNQNYHSARATTESWDVPAPSFTPTPEIYHGLQVYRTLPGAQTIDFSSLSILDLVRGKVVAVNELMSQPLANATDVDNWVQLLVAQDVIAQELRLGLRFNLNRQFGVSGTDITEKIRFARQLYFLLMLLKDHEYSTYVDTAVATNELSSAAVRREITARQLAQWSINVVEFRDPDLTMVPFEYILNPFKYDPAATAPPDRGWSVDRNPGTNEASLPTGDPNHNPDRRLVWGCEAPVLLLTETKAFHDRRVEDLGAGMNRVNATMTGYDDDDYDQRRMPQGSAFVELLCMHNPNGPQPSQDLFNGPNLELSKMSGTNPVWRLAVTESRPSSADNDVYQRFRDRPFTTALETAPYAFNFAAPAENNVTVDRYVWFAASKPGMMHADRDRVFYNRAAAGSNVLIPGGQYVVVGPSRKTVAGSPRENDNVTIIGWHGTTAPQEIQLGAAFHVSDNSGGPLPPPSAVYPSTANEIHPPISIAVGGDREDYDAAWDASVLGPVGFSISEPLFSGNYYPAIPMPGAMNQTTYTLNNNIQVYDIYDPPLDQPLDNTRLLGNEGLLATATTANYKTVLLQRLADPAQPYNNVTNPYITVDWLPIDLTVFNGESNPPKDDANPLTFEANDPNDLNRGVGGNVNFSTRERGSPPPTGRTNQDIWSAVSSIRNNATPPGYPDPPTDNFGRIMNLNHTLGYINQPFHDPGLTGATPPSPQPWISGSTSGMPIENPYGATYRGSPSKPYPWLTWSNNSYFSQFQLMHVPASSPQRLCWEFTTYDSTEDFYNEQPNVARADRMAPVPGTPFGHLLGFFHSSETSAAWNTANSGVNAHNQAGSNYYRLFDYVETPSGFSGMRFPAPPSAFPAPYNQALPSQMPTYRVPGTVNANTICDDAQRTWLGVTNSFNSVDTANPGTTMNYESGNATWDIVRRSRQGYTGSGYLTLDTSVNALPTHFAKPFRSMGGSNYVAALAPSATALRNADGNQFIENTFLRRTNSTGSIEPLFSFLSRDEPYTDSNGNGVWDMGEAYTDTNGDGSYSPYDDTSLGAGDIPMRGHFNNSDNNPYFRYLMYQKTGNVLTTRSNVYAVWVTVGYFEVQRTNIDEGNPDGYELMGELADIDGNTAPRHKAFFLLDRTIPVAFTRGQNYNVHRAMLVNRIVE